jgi:DNA-binding Lrp family transcriptional regulator
MATKPRTKTKLLDDLDEDIVDIVDRAGKLPVRAIGNQLDDVKYGRLLYRVNLLAKEGYIGVFHAHARLVCYSVGEGNE